MASRRRFFGLRREATLRTSQPPARRGDGKPSALTAAGVRITRREAEQVRRLIQQWQAQAFYYYDRLGEIKYAALFYSRGLAPLELYAGEIVTTNGRPEVKPTKNQVAIDLLNRVQDPGGGTAGLLSAYGKLKFLAGECYLFVSVENGVEQWEMLSHDELRITGAGTYMRFKAPSLAGEEYREPDANEGDEQPSDLEEQEGMAYRLWTRHPRFSWLPDSTMMGVLDLCEELLLLRQAVRSRARSRLAGPGWLLIPEELSTPPLEPVGDEDPNEDIFIADLTKYMMAGIQDEGSPSAQVPLISRVPAEFIEKIRHIQISDPTQLYPETGLRREAVESIAIGLDLPPEILTGIMDANHWTAWLIDEQTWKSHLMPMADSFCDDLTASYFRPSLIAANVADAEKYVIAYDATAVINHPDRTKDAKDLHDRGVLSDETLREATGFDGDDAPSPEERQVWLAVKARDPGFAVTGIPTRLSPAAEEEVVAQGGAVTPAGAEDAVKEPPARADSPAESQERAGVPGGYAAERIAGAADVALLRAREVAGNRVRSLAKRKPDILALVEGVPAGQVCAVLGKDRVRGLGCPDERELVAGGRALIMDALAAFGVRDAEINAKVADLVEQHAARTLYSEKASLMPPTFRNWLAGVTKASGEQ